MSGIVAVWRRDGTPVDRAAFQAMLDAQGHRARDGQATWFSPDGRMALAHQHFWTNPEEVGERQPVELDGVALAFDGRLDNRAELAAALALDGAQARALSDAALVLRAYHRWGNALLERLKGPFAFVLFDVPRQQALCARDAVGRRTLCRHHDAGRLLVASEPRAILASGEVADELDEVWLAHYYATNAPSDGRTPFRAVRELLPAHGWLLRADGDRQWCFWQADPAPRLRYRDPAEYTDHFRSLLRQAVERRMRAPSTPAVLMSGGLDSTSVAALAATHLAERGRGERLRVFSWVFDELTSVDERGYMGGLIRRYDMAATHVLGDDAWALRPGESNDYDPNGPETEPFRHLVDRTLRVAQAAGSPILLSGYGGDELFAGAEHWLADLVAHGHLREALSEVAAHARQRGWTHVLHSASVRRLMAQPLRRAGRRSRHLPVRAPWLTPFAMARLEGERTFPLSLGAALRPGQHELNLGALAASRGLLNGARMHHLGVELREPLRDRDLIEFVLGLPAYLLYNEGAVKHLLRQAMRGYLPNALFARARRTSMQPLIDRGVLVHESGRVQRTLTAQDAVWRDYVQAAHFSHDPSTRAPARDRQALLMRCVAVEEWLGERRLGQAAKRPDHTRPARATAQPDQPGITIGRTHDDKY